MKTIFLVGNLGRDAERKTTANGRELMTLNVAVTNRDKSTTWFGVVANYQEGLFPYLVKGRNVAVVGEFDAKVYQNAVDFTVFADNIGLAGGGDKTNTAQEQKQ